MKKYNDAEQIGNFVKGNITELLFERMIREDPGRAFTVIPFGYEKTTPEIAQFRELLENKDILKVIQQSPDFILIKNDKTDIYFVEVKYRKHLSNITKKYLVDKLKSVSQHWPDTWLFMATQDGFYFDSCESVIRNNGAVGPLDDSIILPEIQRKYLMVLKEFIRVKEL